MIAMPCIQYNIVYHFINHTHAAVIIGHFLADQYRDSYCQVEADT